MPGSERRRKLTDVVSVCMVDVNSACLTDKDSAMQDMERRRKLTDE
jgi:hypothetical protein